MRTYAYKGEGVEKSVIRYVHSKWMTADTCCGFFLCALVRRSKASFIKLEESPHVLNTKTA